jgi:ArsR family transcriptional regulator
MKATTKSTPGIEALFRALADRTRLRILDTLRDGEICVCDIVGALNLAQPKISRHLAYLRKARLVTARKDGLWMRYKLADAKTRLHKRLIQCLEDCVQNVPEIKADRKRLLKSRLAKSCG